MCLCVSALESWRPGASGILELAPHVVVNHRTWVLGPELRGSAACNSRHWAIFSGANSQSLFLNTVPTFASLAKSFKNVIINSYLWMFSCTISKSVTPVMCRSFVVQCLVARFKNVSWHIFWNTDMILIKLPSCSFKLLHTQLFDQ